MKGFKLLLFFILFFLISLIFIFSNNNPKTGEQDYIRLDFFKGNLYLNEPPKIGKEIELYFTFSRDIIEQLNYTNPTITFVIPSELTISGPIKWENFEGTQVKTKITVMQKGVYKIETHIETLLPKGEDFVQHKESEKYSLCFKVTDTTGEILENCPIDTLVDVTRITK